MAIIPANTPDANGIFATTPIPLAWNSGTTYAKDQTVTYTDPVTSTSFQWVSLLAGNLNHSPTTAATAYWQVSSLGWANVNFAAASSAITASRIVTNVTQSNGLTLSAGMLAFSTVGQSWAGNVISPSHGGTGIANNGASTITISGAHASTFVITGTTNVTFPTSGTLATVGQIPGTPTLAAVLVAGNSAGGTSIVMGAEPIVFGSGSANIVHDGDLGLWLVDDLGAKLEWDTDNFGLNLNNNSVYGVNTLYLNGNPSSGILFYDSSVQTTAYTGVPNLAAVLAAGNTAAVDINLTSGHTFTGILNYPNGGALTANSLGLSRLLYPFYTSTPSTLVDSANGLYVYSTLTFPDDTSQITAFPGASAFDAAGSASTAQSNAIATAEAFSANASNLTSGTVAASRVATLNQDTTGSAAKLTTPRAINGVNFDGSAAITVAAAASTLTGATLASGVTASSLTSFGASVVLGTPASGTLTNCTISATGITGTTNATITTLSSLAISAGQTTSGTFATSLLGSGSATSSTYLRGDQTWVSLPAALITAVTSANGLTLTGSTLAFSGAAYSPIAGSSSIVTIGTLTSGLVGVGYGGTGQTTANAGFNALSPLTAAGDTLYGGTAGAGTRLGIGTANQAYLTNAGATAPVWTTLTPTLVGLSNVTNVAQVTAVSVATANGISGTSSGGQTPALTLSLAAITPSSVAATGQISTSVAGAASAPSVLVSGTVYTAGSGTTAWPLLLVQPSGTTASTWSAGGCMMGVNAASGYSSDLMNLMVNGTIRCRVDSSGNINNINNLNFGGSLFGPSGAFSIRTGNASTITMQGAGLGAWSTAGTAVTITGGSSVTNSSGTFVGLNLNPTYNQTSAAAAIDFKIARVETALGSGVQKFVSLLSGVSGTTERFFIDNAGNATGANFTGNHLLGGSTAPTIAAGVGAGGSPTIAISGHDSGGIVTLTTGTLPTLSSVVATITFNASYSTAPAVTLTPANGNAAALSGVTMVYVTSTTTTFVINAGTTGLSAATQYIWFFTVIG